MTQTIDPATLHLLEHQGRRMHAALRTVGASSELAELAGDHYINDSQQAEVEARLLAFFRRKLNFPA